MNIHQQHLLDLLKEVDAFCKEHGITYYCAGGTVIGAARHRGFIPWDDDIDIYMKRADFFRFDEALKKYGPGDRVLEYYEGDHERQAAVARYQKKTDTMFCHFNMLGHSAAGTSIDVFILDPLPDSHDERVDYLAKLYAYSDLISPCHVYSHRLPVSKFGVYEKYKRIADEEGRERAVEEVSKELFCYDESECRDFCLRWGSIMLIYPVEVIGEPVYLPFEDMQIPVPHDWYRYLAIHYGMEWYDLPYEETQGEHVNIVRYDMPYDYFYKKRDELYTQDYLLDLHFRWKDAEREFFRVAEPMKDFAADTQNRICRANIEKNLNRSGAESLQALYDEGRYGDICGIFAPYIQMQTSHAYMGRQVRHGLQFRWNFPYIVPLADDELRMLLMSLIMTGAQRMAERIIGIYERAGSDSAAAAEAAAVISAINEANRLYYSGDHEACVASIKASGVSEAIPSVRDLMWLCRVHGGISEAEAGELEALAEAGKSFALKKAWGDLLWIRGEAQRAEAVYRELMSSCRNGLFWMDIQQKVPDIAPIPTKRLTPFTDTEVTRKQKQLLEEIAGICASKGIKYVIGPDLARRMHLTGNVGYINSNKEIFMDAANAARFMEAFKEEGRSDRRLLSWGSGDPVRDFALIYSDSGNIFCDMRRLEQWRDMGIFISIRILRRRSLPKAYRRSILLDEFMLNLINIEKIDKRNLQSAAKKTLYGLSGLTTKSRKNKLKRRLFERSIKAESRAGGGDFYYYTNVRGLRPVKHTFKRSLWDDTAQIEMDGTSYTIPAAVTAGYVANETDLANVPPVDSIFIYRSDDMSWDELSPLIDEDAYAALDWEAYAKARREFRRLDAKVWHCWFMVLKEGEELDIRERASDICSAYRAAIGAGDEAAAAKAMNEVDVTVKKYQALDVPVYLDAELRDCYEDRLKRTGQKDFLKAIRELWDRDRSEYFNN